MTIGYLVQTTFFSGALPAGTTIEQIPAHLIKHANEAFDNKIRAMAYARNQRSLVMPNVTVFSVKIKRVLAKSSHTV